MKLIPIAYKYLKNYPALSIVVLCLVVAASFFEGASFGMLIPLIQSMIGGGASLFEKIPFVKSLNFLPPGMDATKVVSINFIFIFILLAAKNIFTYFSSVLIERLRLVTIKDLRQKLMGNLLEYDSKYFDGAKSGYIISNINHETERIGAFVETILQFIAFSIRTLVYVILLLFIAWKASLAIFLMMACVLLPVELIMNKIKKMSAIISRAMAEYNHKLVEILGGMRFIKARATEGLEEKNFEAVNNALYRAWCKNSKYRYLTMPVSETLIFGLIGISFLIMINVINIDFTQSFPFIAVYLILLGKTLAQLNNLNNRRAMAMSRLAAFTNYESIADAGGKTNIKSGNEQIERFSEEIQFKNVNFSYIKNKNVLNDINIRFPKGRVTALVGASGAGKSTIVNLIPRLYDVDSGALVIDGKDLRGLKLKDWRRKIGLVSQDIFIFNSSVKDNIAYGHAGISEEEIVGAAKAAHAHDFIMNLPDKYDTLMGERGIKLSGGQKQRLSIARSVIHNPEILILDEATSSLDSETERLMTEAINRLTKNRTVIAIAHRLSTILHADNIIVLDKGRVAEQGRHEELIERNGLYKKLYDAQFSV